MRAKRLIFKSSIKKEVEIIVPYGTDLSWAAEIAENRISWIRSAQQHVRKTRSQLKPTQIDLKALDETWTVDYSAEPGGGADDDWNVTP